MTDTCHHPVVTDGQLQVSAKSLVRISCCWVLLLAFVLPAHANSHIPLPQLVREANNRVAEIKTMQTQLQRANADKTRYQANLTSHQKADDWTDSVLNFFVDDRRTKFLKGKIKEADATISDLRSRIASTSAQFETYKAEIRLRTIKANPELLAAETAARYQAAIEAVANYDTQKLQITAGEAAFQARLAELDSLIAERNKQGLTEVAKQFTIDRKRTVEAHDAWLASANAELQGHLDFRRVLFKQNRKEGIGPTNSGMVNTEIRRQARARGESVDDAREQLTDLDAVRATGASAAAVAEGAPRHTQHLSIFTSLNRESLKDFLQDMEETNEGVFTTKDGWYEFSLRMGSYTKGVTVATGDALLDLMMIAREIGDTGMEGAQAILREAGIDADSFGTENLEALVNFGSKFDALMDPNNPEGDRIAKQFVAFADALVRKADRSTEQLSARGDVHKGLYYLGYGTATVAGSERIVFEGGAIVARTVKRTAGALSDLGKADPGPINLSDDLTLGPVDPSLGPGQSGVHAGAVTPDAPTGAATGAGTANKLDEAAGLDDVTKLDSADGAARLDGATAPPPARVPNTPKPKAGDTVRLPNGEEVVLGERLGGGATSEAFAVVGRDDIVVKFTTQNVEAVGDLGGKVLDDLGYQILNDIDPSLVPNQIGPAWTQGSRTAAVFERADDLKKTMRVAAEEAGIAPHLVEMTPGMLRAYREGIEKLIKNKIAFLDNKLDNWALVPVKGKPDTFVFKVIDPGSMAYFKTEEAARGMFRALDAPGDLDDALFRAWLGGEGRVKDMASAARKEDIVNFFRDLFDTERMSRLLGRPVTLDDMPFRPDAGWMNSSLNKAHDLDLAKLDAAAAAAAAPGTSPAGFSLRGALNAGDEVAGSRVPLGPNRLGFNEDGSDCTGDACAGYDSSNGDLILIGGFAPTPTVPPIYFHIPVDDPFGGSGLSPCPPYCPTESSTGCSEYPCAFVMETKNRIGQNPFDQLDPIGENANQPIQSGAPVAGVVPGGGGGGSFLPTAGNYFGTNNCGISFSNLTIAGSNVTFFGQNFIIVGTNANSVSNNITILGNPGHTCQIQGLGPLDLRVFCFETSTPAVNCLEFMNQ